MTTAPRHRRPDRPDFSIRPRSGELPAARHDAASAAMISWLRNASIEIVPSDDAQIEMLRTRFDPGTEIFVNFLPKARPDTSVASAVALRRAGFVPVPHIAARSLADMSTFENLITRLGSEADVDTVLAIAGDPAQARGSFSSVLDLMEAGVFESHGIRAVGFAGHPEEPPHADRATLDASLMAKLAGADKRGLESFVVTQFAFDAAPLVAYLGHLDELGVSVPVKIGLAGPATLPQLIRFGVRCGVGASLKNLRLRSQTVGQLIGDAGPDELLRDVATAIGDRENVGIHFFPFGGVEKTADWIETTLSLLYEKTARRRT